MPDDRLPHGAKAMDESATAASRRHVPVSRNHGFDKPKPDPLESELLDLYGAMLVAIPVALFLNSLWL